MNLITPTRMKSFDIQINGEMYPCGMTMGAFLDFKQQTGYDLSKADISDISDNITLMWCAVRSTCRREKKEFNLTLTEFSDAIGFDTLADFQKKLAEYMGGSQKK